MSLVRASAGDLAQRGIDDHEVDRVCRNVEEGMTWLEDPNHLANAAAMMGAYRSILRNRGGSVWGANRAMVTIARIEAALGEKLHGTGKDRRGGRVRDSSKSELSTAGQPGAVAEPLPDGITKSLSHRVKLLHDWGTDHLQAFVQAYEDRPKDYAAPKDLLARSRIYAAAKAELKAKKRKTTATAIAADDTIPIDLPVIHGSFVDVAASLADDSVDLVFTDPPYHDRHLPVYADLGTVAQRVLKDGASLITYTSHHRMPEVIDLLHAAGLTFFWPLAMVHTGQLARMTEYGIVVHWKPLLWFVKGRFRRRGEHMTFVNDLVQSTQEKGSHDWQQSVVEADYYIRQLTKPGEFVFDPFCGGGTTAIAAQRAGRCWLTCDIDEDSVWIARDRIAKSMMSGEDA